MATCVSSRASFENTFSLYKKDTEILRKKNTNRNESADWTSLPNGLSHKILGILGYSTDFISFALTCRAWSTVLIIEGVLDLSFYSLLKDSQLIILMQMLKEKASSIPQTLVIHTFNLSGCNRLTHKGFSSLKNWPMTTLNLEGCSIDYRCVNKLKRLTHLKHIHFPKLYRDRCYTSLIDIRQENLNFMNGLHVETISFGPRRLSQPKKTSNPKTPIRSID